MNAIEYIIRYLKYIIRSIIHNLCNITTTYFISANQKRIDSAILGETKFVLYFPKFVVFF